MLFLYFTPTHAYDLTGAWQDENSSTYCIRQIGNQIYWNVNDLPNVHNIFTGSLAGDYVTGQWIDLPGGNLFNYGALSIRIESNSRRVKIGQSSNYLASVWTRVNDDLCAAQQGRCFDGTWLNTDHVHQGCSKIESYCITHKVDLTFTTGTDGKTVATMTNLTMKEKNYDTTSGRWEFTMHWQGGPAYGSGWLTFAPDCKSFKSWFEDESGHRGPWSGQR